MSPDPKKPRDSKPPRSDDSFPDLEKLDRPELDEDADWENETGVRRVHRTSQPPPKLAGCA